MPAKMPLAIKAFLGACAAIVVLWIVQQYLLFDSFPNEGYSLRERMAAMRWRLLLIVVESALVLSLAWMAAFRRQNWARWALAGLLVAGEFLPLITYAMRGDLLAYLEHAFVRFDAAPTWYAELALKAAAIVLVLQHRVEPWFRPTNLVL